MAATRPAAQAKEASFIVEPNYMVQGREMPFPANPGGQLNQVAEPLTLDELELVNDWILEGAPLNQCQ